MKSFCLLALLSFLLAVKAQQPATSGPVVVVPIDSCPNFWEYDCPGYHFTLANDTVDFRNYHVISFENFTANTGDIQGRLAVKKDAQIGCGYSIGDGLITSGPNAPDQHEKFSLIVGRNLDWCSGELFPVGSSAAEREDGWIGGNFTGANNIGQRLTKGTCTNCLEQEFTLAQACYTNTSNYWGNLQTNVKITIEFSTIVFECLNNSAPLYAAYLESERMDLGTAWELRNCNASAKWVINIIGTGNIVFKGGEFPAEPQNVLWNILGCGRNITVITGVNGSILAPWNILACTSGVIRGKVVVFNIVFVLQVNIIHCPAPGSPQPTTGGSTITTTPATQCPVKFFGAFNTTNTISSTIGSTIGSSATVV